MWKFCKTPAGSLGVTSLLCALLWRMELEWRWGWAGLNWITETHYSAVLIPAVFSLWLYAFAPFSRKLFRVLRSLTAFGGGIIGYVVYGTAFSTVYSRFILPGPLHGFFITVIFILIPVCYTIFAFLTSPCFQRHMWVTVPLCFTLSYPLALILMKLTAQPGYTDLIHTVKTGFIFPGFILSAGFPFLDFRSPVRS